jgi:hypothetical protein
MRLRGTLLLVLLIASVVILGAWTDKPHVKVKAPAATPAEQPWSALLEISRRGRRLDGFRPTVTVTGLRGAERVGSKEVGEGEYKVQVVFPHPGYYTYTVRVADRVMARGSVYAIPK